MRVNVMLCLDCSKASGGECDPSADVCSHSAGPDCETGKLNVKGILLACQLDEKVQFQHHREMFY